MPSARWSISLFDINNEERASRRTPLARLPVSPAARTSHRRRRGRRPLFELLLLFLHLLLVKLLAAGLLCRFESL